METTKNNENKMWIQTDKLTRLRLEREACSWIIKATVFSYLKLGVLSTGNTDGNSISESQNNLPGLSHSRLKYHKMDLKLCFLYVCACSLIYSSDI